MWFHNLQLYRLPTPWAITAEQLREQLARGPFFSCPSSQPQARGWSAPRKDGELLHAMNGAWMIRLDVETKLLPSSVINAEVRAQAEKLEATQGYGCGRKQLRKLRERVTSELMPRAFTERRATHVWIDPQAGWFCVDAGTPGKADQVIEHLRRCLDDFPLTLLRTQVSPQAAMADWLASGEAPAGFTVDRDCSLKAVGEEKSQVSYKRCPLDNAKDVREHLASGKMPTSLALTWDDRISFVLDEKLTIKRLAFLDLLKEEAEQNAETADDQFDADFALMTGELGRFLPALVAALGGEVRDGDL
jgi:recombination associated protein RdgC